MTRPTSFKRETGWTLLAAALPLLFGLLLLARDPQFFWHDDAQLLFLPAFADIARALAHGEWPLISPNSWYAGNYLGELQFGLFSVFIMGLNAVVWALPLSLPGAAAAIAIPHLMVLAAGAFRLARHYGLPAGLGLMVAVAASLNGWNLTWAGIGWLSHLTSFAWVPWAWWALRHALNPTDGQGSGRWWALAGLFIYLVITAGWPPTVFMLMLVCAMLAGQTLAADRSARRLLPLAAAWALGLGLSAPALLPFVEYVSHTARAQVRLSMSSHEWQVPFHALWGFFYPGEATVWSVYHRVKPHLPIELANGVVPAAGLLLAAVALRRPLWKRQSWELGLLAVVLLLCLLPGFGMFRWSFRWLSLVHLVMPLVAAQALMVWAVERPPGRPAWLTPGAIALAAALLGWALSFRLPVLPFSAGLWLLAPVAAWALVDALPALSRLRPAAPVLVALVSLWVTFSQIPTTLELPAWPMPEAIRDPRPLDPHVRYLALAHVSDYFAPAAFERPFGELLRPGNSYNYAGVEFVNGYSSLGLLGLNTVLQPGLNGYLMEPVTTALTAREAGPQGLLQQMAVDGLVLGGETRRHQALLARQGWEVRAAGPEGVVMHRVGPASPRVRAIATATFVPTLSAAAPVLLNSARPPGSAVVVAEPQEDYATLRFGPVGLTPVKRDRLTEVVRVKTGPAPGLVLFSRPWYPGLVAQLDGKPLPVRVINLCMPGVILPPEASGELELAYRPWTLALGLYLAALTLLALGLFWASVRYGRRGKPLASPPVDRKN
jgi:hypothetical protein